ncbi:hybrid sensor histidine kinase/response regulator [Coraliomargarita sp. SDUM461003]|uniref:histidine kinase n=1 Tax=Thalassobacterium maritimum TaxID=3041265 RepID=A0ABU1AQ42_9BACT|nr:hybrid sensor histidine kinase/response regulator [Coraliomargarita sp. SDUM461003]MDQ8206284.1 hybrid sensor histidine kinase/response regulator [Coraliomargarita sp. SDUM461003]
METQEQPSIPKVLIVDDEPQNLRLVGEILRRAEIGFILALNGQEALDAVVTEKPDLILLDVMMPQIDGFEVCARLKKDPQTAEIPVIFLSAATSPAEVVSGFTAGAVDYIKKPFVREELMARVHTHLRLSATQRQLDAESKAKADLLARLAHDIKNPSGAIKGLTNFILEELKGCQHENLEEILSMTRLIQDSADGMSDLVVGILDEARSHSSSTQHTVTETIQVAEVIEYLLHLNHLSAKEKEIHIEFANNAPAKVAISRRILVEMFDNLLNNAIKYSAEGTTIHIHLSPSQFFESGMRFEVIDQAPTINETLRKGLFTAFVRGDSRHTHEPSHGVGLSIVQRLVQMHSGKVGVEASERGEGNRFYIELPTPACH